MIMAYQSIMENLGFTAGPIIYGFIYRSYAEQCDQACLAAHVNTTTGTCDAVHLRPAPDCTKPANVWIIGGIVGFFAWSTAWSKRRDTHGRAWVFPHAMFHVCVSVGQILVVLAGP